MRPAGTAPHTIAVGYASPGALRAALAGRDGRVVRRLPALRIAEIRARRDAPALARALRAQPGIRFVETVTARSPAAEPALAVSPATGASYEWQVATTRLQAVPQAALRAAVQIPIAVVDTGADVTAPDLAAKTPVTWSVVAGSGDVTDTSGHGTFVASIAAGSGNNDEGIVGFAGDAPLLVVQANRGNSTFTDIDEANAIVWAVDHGAKIVNLSIGGATTSKVERGAIDYAVEHGVLLVAAAGNDFQRGNPVEYPAALIQPVGSNGVGGSGLVVGAATESGEKATFSSSGSFVSVAAPGVNVLGAIAATAAGTSYSRVALPGSVAGGYGYGSGTSYAAPQVAGAAALVWGTNPLLTAQQVAQIVKSTAQGRGSWNPGTGYGMIDVAAAVAAAAGTPPPTASVKLSGKRVGGSVKLAWAGTGASAYRLKVRTDSGPARVLLSGAARTAVIPLAKGHTYVFTVDVVTSAGAALASSTPFRVAVTGPPVAKTTAKSPSKSSVGR